ncbi:25399_t:CDS:1, partial [Racocetra persica]
KIKRNQKREEIQVQNLEAAIAPEILVDYMLEALPTEYSSDNYLFEKKFFVALDPLLDIINTNSEEQEDKEITQCLINRISKADLFFWIYHKREVTKSSIAYVYYCNSREELKNKKPQVDNISNQRDTATRIHRYDCGGTIRMNIDRKNNLIVVNIYHFLHLPPETIETTLQIQNYITKNYLLT